MKITHIIQAMSLSVFLTASCTTAETTTTENDTTESTEVSTPKAPSSVPTLTELEKDPDVLWMGETQVDYGLNYNRWDYDRKSTERLLMENLGFKGSSSFKILKYQVSDLNNSHNDDHSLLDKVLKNRKDMKFYKEATLETLCTPKEVEYEIARVDTFIVENPETKEKKVQVMVNTLYPEDIKGFRVRQVIYYSKKEMTFKSIALAVAPLLYDAESEVPSPADLKPLFWMKATALTTAPDLSNSDVKWAKRLYRSFELSNVKIIKQEQDIAKIIDIMMADFRANPETTKLGITFNADGTEYFSSKDIEQLGTSIDTLITFDPNTFAEKIQVVETKMDENSVKTLRLIQDWVWNDETQSLSIRYVGFAPIINRVDDQGKFLNSGPMFIRKVEDIQ